MMDLLVVDANMDVRRSKASLRRAAGFTTLERQNWILSNCSKTRLEMAAASQDLHVPTEKKYQARTAAAAGRFTTAESWRSTGVKSPAAGLGRVGWGHMLRAVLRKMGRAAAAAGSTPAVSLRAVGLVVEGNQTGEGYSDAQPGGNGGGLAVQGDLTLSLSRVAGNHTVSTGSGGGISLVKPEKANQPELSWVITSTQILSNAAGISGGGIDAEGEDLRLEALVLAENRLTNGDLGSGLLLKDGDFSLLNLTIAKNQGGLGCGACIFASTVAITNTIVAAQQVGIYTGADASDPPRGHPLGIG